MSKKKLIILAAMTVALIVVFAAYMIINSAPDDDNGNGETTQTTTTTEDSGSETTGETTTARDTDIFDFTTPDISMITLEVKDADRIILKRELKTVTTDEGDEVEVAEYTLLEPKGFVIDQSPTNSFAAALGWIYESRYIGEVDDLSQYGLDDPAAKLEVELNDGQVLKLDIGDAAIDGNSYYVATPGSSEVKMISASKANSIMIGIKDLLSVEIFEMEPDDVTAFSIKRKGEDKIVVRKKPEELLNDPRSSFEQFRVLEPLRHDANSSNILQNIQALLSSSVDEYIELGAQELSKYGLQDPEYLIQLSDSDDNTVSLELGYKTEEGNARYAKFDGADSVFTLRDQSLVLIDMPLKEIVSSFIYIVNIKDVIGIDIAAEGYSLQCEIRHIAGEDDKIEEEFYVNGQDANAENEDDKSYFRALYQSLIGVSRVDFELDAAPELDPEITITYKFDGLSDAVVQYVKKDDYHYYAFIDGVYTGILVRDTNFYGDGNLYDNISKMLDNLK